MSAEFTIDDKELKKLFADINKKLSREMQEKKLAIVAQEARMIAIKETPKKTGAGQRGWKANKKNALEWELMNTNKHASYLEFGTGIHGYKRTMIKPKTKKFLYIPLRPGAKVWRPGFKRGKDFILVKESRGMKAQPFLSDVVKKVNSFFVSTFSKAIDEATR